MARAGPEKPTRLPVVADGSTLCVACGLCCSGVLFTHAPLRDDELALAAEIGLSVAEPQGAGRVFTFPCPALDGARCGVYPRRPAVCGDFKCALLKRYERGRIGLDAALERVRAVQAIVAECSPEELSAIRRGRRSAPDPVAYAREHARELELGERLSMLLRADF